MSIFEDENTPEQKAAAIVKLKFVRGRRRLYWDEDGEWVTEYELDFDDLLQNLREYGIRPKKD